MIDDSDDTLDVDVLAAMLRQDAAAGADFLELLAKKLSGALPEHTSVERGGGSSAQSEVTSVSVRFSHAHYHVKRERHGPQALKSKVVRGIALSTKELELEVWATEIAHELRKLATKSTQTREALERFIIGEDL
jgi:hypothetical protein